MNIIRYIIYNIILYLKTSFFSFTSKWGVQGGRALIFSLLIIGFMNTDSYALLGLGKLKSLFKAEFSAVKAEMGDIKTNVKTVLDTTLQMQSDIKANGSAIAGFNNDLQQINKTVSAGRDYTENSGNTNDTGLMKDYVNLYRYVIGGLIALLIKAYVILFFVIKSLLKARDKDDAFEDKITEKLLKLNGEKK